MDGYEIISSHAEVLGIMNRLNSFMVISFLIGATMVGAADKATIEGIVTDTSGHPLKGADVSIYTALVDANGTMVVPIINKSVVGVAVVEFDPQLKALDLHHTQTDKNGHYRIKAPPKNYRYRVRGPIVLDPRKAHLTDRVADAYVNAGTLDGVLGPVKEGQTHAHDFNVNFVSPDQKKH
jgi:hypothetical protein